MRHRLWLSRISYKLLTGNSADFYTVDIFATSGTDLRTDTGGRQHLSVVESPTRYRVHGLVDSFNASKT
jgi:hypothetical protein